MPVAAAVNSIWQVRVRGSMEAQETNNVMHFACVGSSSDVELQLILALAQCFIQHLIPIVTSTWALQDLVWKQVSPTLGPESVTIPTGTLVGQGAGAALPSYSSVVFSVRTALGGRSHRGRFYIPGIPENATIGSKIDKGAAFWTGMLSFVACLASKFIHTDPAGGSDLFNMGVYSRKIGGDHFPYSANGFTAMTQIQAHDVLATTRSRKVREGR